MQVLPVLDVLRQQVVRGQAGDRANYRKIVSRLTTSGEPLTVARAMREAFGLNHFYLADLDGILYEQPNLDLYRRLISDGFQLLVDAGIRHSADALAIRRSAEGIGVIVGLETCRSPQELEKIVSNSSNVTFSLDLVRGIPRRFVNSHDWSERPDEIVRQVVQSNVNSILVLDLADVGMGTGGSTDAICQSIRGEFPSIHLIAGGGVRSREDLLRFVTCGVDAVLVASALHDGRLEREDVHPA